MLATRLRFETLLSALSAGLIHVSAPDTGVAIERALRQVVTFLGVDRGGLDEHAEGRPRLHVSWARPGLEEPPPATATDQFPWVSGRLREGEVVRFSRLAELPEAAAIDRASFERVGAGSQVLIPLRTGGPILGVLSFASVRAGQAWPDDLVERLRLLSEAFAGVLDRRRMELSLAERLRFEQLLSSLATAFSHLSAADFDRAVQHGLRQVVDFLAVDRGSLIEFTRDGTAARSWAVEEWMEVGEFPWMTARLQRGEVINVSQLEELPDEAAVDRQSYLLHRVKPQVAVPLLVSGIVVGGLVFSTVGAERARSDELIQQLHLLGEVFANALARKQGELEAQRLRQDLTHIGRVSALGELTASLTHELSQPLTAILSNAQTAQRLVAADVVDLESVREILSDIVTDDKRAAAVISGLRALIRKGEPEFMPLDLNVIVGEVTWLLRSDTIMRNVSMSLELAPDLPRVRGDRVQLQQVVLNLVLNGFEAMREPHAGARTLVIRTARDGAATLRVTVQDSGPGIAEKDRGHIFEPLYTTKTEGLGMGLAIVRTIVHAHGGAVEAENNPQGGASLHVTLPVAPEGAH
ncbi:MAG TPA: ATP-binding protein [Methylomirabilota bacterium]|nr:ATP-binding protein [Methylomirabilota bacterium]